MDFAIINTPIGALYIAEEDGFITEIRYNGRFAVDIPPQTELLKEAVSQIESYFMGQLKEFTLPLNPKVSPYRRKVLDALAKVPYAHTVTYKDLALATDNPQAARAVGSAMRTNPIMLVIPCHRVLKSDGSLGNYSAGGPANKDWLLSFEKQNR